MNGLNEEKSLVYVNFLQFLRTSLPHYSIGYPFPKRKILDPSKLKEFAEDNFKVDENGIQVSKWIDKRAMMALKSLT